MNKNVLKTYLFLTVLSIATVLFFSIIFGHAGTHIGVLIAIITIIIALFNSDKAMLRLYHVKEANEAKYAHLQAILKALATKASMPTPKLYTVNTPAANIFGVGKTAAKGGIVITEGLLSLLSEEEQTAVIAYILGQIGTRQTFLNAVVSVIAGGFSGLANLHVDQVIFDEKEPKNAGYNRRVMEIVAPIAAFIVRSVIKKDGVLKADANAITYGAHAAALVSALQKLTADATKTTLKTAYARPATAHLFIINPLKDGTFLDRFDTYPSLEARVAALAQSKADK